MIVPDVAGWRRERWQPAGDEVGVQVAPDWACEILSPRTERLDRGSKMDAYVRAGVGFVWLIDPALRMVEAFRAEGGKWVRLGAWQDDVRARIAPFEAIEVAIGGWWLPDAAPR